MHPFQAPYATTDPPPDAQAVGVKALGTPCVYPGFCQGRASADWLTCSSACAHCNPPRRRRRSATRAIVPGDLSS